MKPTSLLWALLVIAGGASPAWSAGALQRYALVVGANAGGSDRPQLQYAVSDAERFARVMVELGGIATANAIVLRQPRLRELTDALDVLARHVTNGRRTAGAAGGRTEIIVYYSGHADEKGLLLGDDRYSYRTLRDRLDQIPADVRIAVLDACSSGAFTRIKSGRPRPAFLVDESSDMRGHAFLTSSSESEAAQESDRIRASFFTHYLVSGFRGAADLSGDGKVTLNEAYQFAFNETLGRTTDTKAGAQHPSYDISLSGTGDVVMTDVRQTTATLVLAEELEGRFFIRSVPTQDLIVELYKPAGRKVELAIEPGAYDIRVERAKGAGVAKADVGDGARVTLDARLFGAAPPAQLTQRRGSEVVDRFAVAGRQRLAMRLGVWRSNGPTTTIVSTGQGDDVFAGLEYTHFVRENLAFTFAIDAFGVSTGTFVGPNSVASGVVGGVSLPLGVRWNPLSNGRTSQSFKPFLAVGLGPVIGTSEGNFISGKTISSGSTTRGTIGGHIGGGVDVHLARSFSVDVEIGYNGMANFSDPVGLHRNFNGMQVAVGLGWLFGKGYASANSR